MANLNLKSLITTLNPLCQQTLEAAAGACLSASHYNVEIEHWLQKLLTVPNSDVALIIEHYRLDQRQLFDVMTQNLLRYKTGNMQPPALSLPLIDLIREALLVAKLEFGAEQVRSGYIFYALLNKSGIHRLAGSELHKINIDILRQEITQIINPSVEQEIARQVAGQEDSLARVTTPALDQYTINLTELARAGKIDPVIGREEEIRQVIDILTRRRQNNPILTGEPGVGKTAIVEGFALRIAKGQVPPVLQQVALHTLDLGLLQAGAGIKGEFENRLKAVIEEVQTAAHPIVLFIDEAHTLVGAGAQAGQSDAANLLKPALARGELRTIAATTWGEYKKYFEQDAALTRRFQVVKVEEPSEEVAMNMLRGLSEHLQRHHGVRILDEAISTAVRLSGRYIAHRQLPDKAISVLDTACARLAIRESMLIPLIEDYQTRLENLASEIAVLVREEVSGVNHAKRLEQLRKAEKQNQQQLEQLQARCQQEKQLIDEIRRLRLKLENMVTDNEPDKTVENLKKQLKKASAKLNKLQAQQPLLQDCVDAQAVAEVIAAWTGIPLGRMVNDETRIVLELEQRLQTRIMGQTHALTAIAQRIQTSRAQLTDPAKPIGTFLLVGPSGVGKTETAIALAEILYGGTQNMSVINLSEFKEEHKVSLLLGAPPGYVGYGEGGILTEAVRRRPYSLVLLDEVEKAHPGVQDIFYQVFDKGVLRDGQGRDISFKNTMLILTSNVGSELISKLCADPETMPDVDTLKQALQPELLKVFKPAFLGRVTVVPYLPLSDQLMHQIIELQLQQIQQRVVEHYAAELTYDSPVVSHIAERCKEINTGARMVYQQLTSGLLPELSVYFLTQLAENKKIKAVHVSVDENQRFIYQHS